ncbi:MAG: PilZ domain-containing protein [Chloroflexi bacterium]|nr:PilZ domain-containing protein [Chloroflexota bacterium]
MVDYSNRRKEARKLIVTFTLVYDAKRGKLLGYLRDLTMSGARISGKKKLDIGTDVALSIELPNDLLGVMAKEVSVAAKVASCNKISENPDNYEIGFEFTNLQGEEAELIAKLLERYHFRHI